MNYDTISRTRYALESGSVKVRDLVDTLLERIEKKNPDINAFSAVHADEARAQAHRIQEKINAGTAGKLAGAVLGVKEVFCQKGRLATCASRMLENYRAVYDATVIQKLLDEDAIIIGRLNMDEFAMGGSTENTIYGPARNPHDNGRVTGGSSGGSAAAVAAGMCNGSLGSDTGGSVRQPASYCGVVGLKPTYGRISRYGLIAFASSFDTVGPMAQDVRDAALLLEALSGHDARDGTSSREPVPDYAGMLSEVNGDFTVGIPREYLGEGLNPEIRSRVKDLASEMERSGARIKPIQLPHLGYAIAAYYVLATAEASSNLARYDGIRFGHRADMKKVHESLREEQEQLKQAMQESGTGNWEGETEKIEPDKIDSAIARLYKQSRTEGFGTEVKRRIMLGTYVLSAGYYEAYYGKAQRVRRLIRRDFQNAFGEVDVILSPTTPTTAFPLASRLDDPLQMYLNDIYTISANLAGICAISIPAGFHTGDNLPYGVQFMADAFAEPRLLQAAFLAETICRQKNWTVVMQK